MNIINISHKKVIKQAQYVSVCIANDFKDGQRLKLYGVPRGGIPCVYLVFSFLKEKYFVNGFRS
jgi:hypothetical protein